MCCVSEMGLRRSTLAEFHWFPERQREVRLWFYLCLNEFELNSPLRWSLWKYLWHFIRLKILAVLFMMSAQLTGNCGVYVCVWAVDKSCSVSWRIIGVCVCKTLKLFWTVLKAFGHLRVKLQKNLLMYLHLETKFQLK